ncbi:MAG: glycosyltransferase family 2 protein [Brevinematales bacterium]|nr:glycosyltransferase family 2 protein [Brevinematales bacterium]
MGAKKPITPEVAIILVNYKNYRQTLECLESLIRGDYTNFRAVVVDNGSDNESLDEMIKWADGTTEWDGWETSEMRPYSDPPVKKPVPYVVYTRKEAEQGGSPAKEAKALRTPGALPLAHPLVFIRSDENLGFAGGNNLGIRYAQAAGNAGYYWLLNTDTVVRKDTLSELTAYMERPAHWKTGMTGGKLLYYHSPDTIQCVSGLLNPKYATSKNLGAFEKDHGQYDREDIPIDYIQGACMFIRAQCLADTGPMNEEYFLYFEEPDWAIRVKRAGWDLGYCPKAVVYHKEGGSMGYSPVKKTKPEMMDYYSFRSRILFTKKYYPRNLWLVKLSFIGVIINRILRLQFGRIRLIIDTVFLNKQAYVKDKKVPSGKKPSK